MIGPVSLIIGGSLALGALAGFGWQYPALFEARRLARSNAAALFQAEFAKANLHEWLDSMSDSLATARADAVRAHRSALGKRGRAAQLAARTATLVNDRADILARTEQLKSQPVTPLRPREEIVAEAAAATAARRARMAAR